MKMHPLLLAALTLILSPSGNAQITPSEMVAPKLEISGANLNFTVQSSISGRNYQLQCSDTLENGTWTDMGVVRSGDGGDLVITQPYESAVQRRFFRVAIVEATPAPAGFSLISAGSFQMGDAEIPGSPVHTVHVDAFYMAKYFVTKALWDDVQTWGLTHGYTDLVAGAGKSTNHPVQTISWYDMVKWCNARSQMENLTPCYTVSGTVYLVDRSDRVVCDWNANGYRLPTEAEWEKAARGGLINKRFPWGDTITHSEANYYSEAYYSYDVSPTRGMHPTYATGDYPYTSPVGSFSPNGYGLYDMAGNVWELCWDQVESGLYSTRGSSCHYSSNYCRVAARGRVGGNFAGVTHGFRVVRRFVP